MYMKHCQRRSSSSRPSAPGRKVSDAFGISYIHRLTVDPRVDNNLRSLWELQLGDSRLDTLILQCSAFDGKNLITISRSMQVRSQTNIELQSLRAQVDHGFVEFVSLPDVVSDCDAAIDLGKALSGNLRLEIRNDLSLRWFLQSDGLEVKIGVGWPLCSDE
jgi:hypothetical protein